jgi:hypothetical protein
VWVILQRIAVSHKSSRLLVAPAAGSYDTRVTNYAGFRLSAG